MIKAVVFDLDHTLFDRYATLSKIVDEGLHVGLFAEGLDPDCVKQEWIYADKNFVHIGWGKIFDHLSSKAMLGEGVTRENIVRDYVYKFFDKVAVPFDFAVDMLAELRKEYKVGLITNGLHDVQAKKLTMLGLEDSFDVVMISGDYPVEKPDPRIFEIMAEKLGVSTAEMCYVGDHPVNDVDASRRAGCTPIWVNTTGLWALPEIERAAYRVDTVRELRELLKTMEG